jgi:hypothetical protein
VWARVPSCSTDGRHRERRRHTLHLNKAVIVLEMLESNGYDRVTVMVLESNGYGALGGQQALLALTAHSPPGVTVVLQ